MNIKEVLEYVKVNYSRMKKKMFKNEDWEMLSKKERVDINNIFIYRYLYMQN